MQLTPNEGYYLPKKVSLRENDGTTSSKTYTYNSENGNLTIAIDKTSSTDPVCLNVNVECVDIPWLRTPSIEVDQLQSLLNITPTKNTSNIKVSIDNELVEEVSATNGCSYNIVDLNTTYGFSLNSSTGYYVSENANKPSSYAICKLNISAEKPSILKLLCINQNEANFDYGMLSNLDTVLKSSSTVDTSGVYKTFKGITSSTPQEVIYDIPTGEHLI